MAPGLVSAEKAARGKRPTDVWFHTIVPTNGREKTGYPTQKPEGVLRRIVAASSRPGGWCLDPFAGSGTLGAVCRQLGRRFVLIDDNPVAVEVMQGAVGSAAGAGSRVLSAHSSCTSGTNLTGSSRCATKPSPRRAGERSGAGSRPPTGCDQASAVGELLTRASPAPCPGRRGDVDRVERSLLGQALPAVADEKLDVVPSPALDRRWASSVSSRVALDRPHVAGSSASSAA